MAKRASARDIRRDVSGILRAGRWKRGGAA